MNATIALHENGLGNLLGRSPVMKRVFTLIQRVAPTEATVMITGESGVGKELVAECIHLLSHRSQGPLVAINCGSIPASLIEAELFGYEKGSFTGASRSHAGVFERATGGTLLLDEVTEMPMDMQTRLLRVLETGRFYRVGGTQEIKTDIRVAAATNRNVLEAVANRQLREDLMYRLAVFPLHVPPLRERVGDAPLLAEHFLRALNRANATAKTFSAAFTDALRTHRWPGNVRELKNSVERSFILADDVLDIDLSLSMSAPEQPVEEPRPAGLHVPLGSRLDEAERSLIEVTLDYCEGDKRRAAAVLGCSLKTLYNKLNSYARSSNPPENVASRSRRPIHPVGASPLSGAPV
ncbi:MAG TPA: sigma-54 dependent transcriptional regulator [Steroidobacter sp.]|nr:sigma-54 dependent transcriptional regulator [Steroidobacteraceae bacterium]HLS81653.1 sigma-54 dependent transcriptional regulator [Steroidobacter sp.]